MRSAAESIIKLAADPRYVGGRVGVLAVLHTLGAFAILTFLVVHLYMTTTGHSLLAHIKAMITGWEEVEKGEAVEAWEVAHERKPPAA